MARIPDANQDVGYYVEDPCPNCDGYGVLFAPGQDSDTGALSVPEVLDRLGPGQGTQSEP